jgi:hypothetical protein
MARLKCICGRQLSSIQSCGVGRFLSDTVIDSFDTWSACEIITRSIEVFECPECGRLAFGNNKDSSVKWYKPEDDKIGNLAWT